MAGVNEELQDRSLRHAVRLQRYARGEVRRILRLLEREVLPEILARVVRDLERGLRSRGHGAAALRSDALVRLDTALGRTVQRGLVGEVFPALRGALVDLASAEATFAAASMRATIGVQLGEEVVSPEILRGVVDDRPIVGDTLSGWFERQSQATQRSVTRTIRQGIAEGDDVGSIVRALRGTRSLGYTDGVLQATRRQVETIVRTSIRSVASQAREAVYEQNDDLIYGIRYLATLDGRTTLICISASSRDEHGLGPGVYPVGKGPRPSLHPGCRSDTAPLIKGLEDLPPAYRSARAPGSSRADDLVPAETSYGEWLSAQPEAFQREVLGRQRWELWRAGDVTIDRFTDESHHVLSLAELIQAEGVA